MQRELRDVSKERAEEASSIRTKQLQYDRQLADMSLTISKLQASLRDAQRGSSHEGENGSRLGDGDSNNNNNKAWEIQNLSEQLVRQQEKLERATTEISALRSRLQVASYRAEKAEDALASMDTYDVERAPVSGMRRRGLKQRRDDTGSIRSAMRLTSTTNENTERIGKAIDAVDRFSVDAGACVCMRRYSFCVFC